MFKSKITVKELFGQVKADADIAAQISDASMMLWYNSLMRSLYLDIIKSVKAVSADVNDAGSIIGFPIEAIKRIVFEGLPELERVSALFAAGTERPVWYALDEQTVAVKNVDSQGECTVYMYELPSYITSTTTSSEYVPLPDNFVELAKYKLLAEMYNAANDDVLSAKYFGFYNARLSDFTLWILQNAPSMK